MTTHNFIIPLLGITIFFGISGWLCIFKTDMLVNMGQKNYGRSKLARSAPNSDIVARPWYPEFIRCAGIFIWLWAAVMDYLVFTGRFH